jgi:uncharacterized phage-associated protein
MSITQEDVKDWSHHPVTQQIFKEIKAIEQRIIDRERVYKSIDETALNAAYIQGFRKGVKSLEDAYFNLSEEGF